MDNSPEWIFVTLTLKFVTFVKYTHLRHSDIFCSWSIHSKSGAPDRFNRESLFEQLEKNSIHMHIGELQYAYLLQKRNTESIYKQYILSTLGALFTYLR